MIKLCRGVLAQLVARCGWDYVRSEFKSCHPRPYCDKIFLYAILLICVRSAETVHCSHRLKPESIYAKQPTHELNRPGSLFVELDLHGASAAHAMKIYYV